LRRELIGIVLLAVAIVFVTAPSAKATVPITVNFNPLTPSPYSGFTVSGQFVGYGSGVHWVMYVDTADPTQNSKSLANCVPGHDAVPPLQGTTGSDGTYSAWINGQRAGNYLVTVRDDFGDNSGRACFTIA